MEPRTVEWGGSTWYRYPESERRSDRVYYKRSVPGTKPQWLHRAIWERANGRTVPPKHHVHHIDENPFNNDPGNLEAKPGREHLSEHMVERWIKDPSGQQRGLEAARAKAPEWHRSEEGRAWHREHGREVMATQPRSTIACAECGAEFQGRAVAKFCGSKCTQRWHARERRKSGIDNIERVCWRCKQPFTVNKYSKQRACSRVCPLSSGSP